MNESREKELLNTDNLKELSRLIDMGLGLPLRLTKTGVRMISDSIQSFQNKSKDCKDHGKHSCDCDWCNADCWDHEFCSCCYTSNPPTDLWIDARMGEIRLRKFVIENNRKMDVKLSVEVINLMDACGNKLSPNGVIITSPDKEVIVPACSCIDAQVNVVFKAPLKPNNTYYAEIIIIKGECAPDPITLGFHIEPEDIVDHLVLYDPCRPQKGRFVEFESCCICGCSPSSCGCSKTRKYYLCNNQQSKDDSGNDIQTAEPKIDTAGNIENVKEFQKY